MAENELDKLAAETGDEVEACVSHTGGLARAAAAGWPEGSSPKPPGGTRALLTP